MSLHNGILEYPNNAIDMRHVVSVRRYSESYMLINGQLSEPVEIGTTFYFNGGQTIDTSILFETALKAFRETREHRTSHK